MKFSFLKRDLPKSAVLAVVALAAVAGVVTGREKPAVEVVESRPARMERTADAPAVIDLSKLNRGESIAPQSDPFAQRSFAPEQPAAPQGEATVAAAPAAPPLPSDLAAYLDEIERDILERALERHRYNRTAAGASLGLSLRQMRYRMARLGVGVADNVPTERGDLT